MVTILPKASLTADSTSVVQVQKRIPQKKRKTSKLCITKLVHRTKAQTAITANTPFPPSVLHKKSLLRPARHYDAVLASTKEFEIFH